MSAKDAIEKIRQAKPELVLLDLHLKGGSSGLEVARAVRDIDDLTIVFVTANPLRLDDDMAGALGVIAKPFSSKLILASLAYLEECVHRPPPLLDRPPNLRLAPPFSVRFDTMRGIL